MSSLFGGRKKAKAQQKAAEDAEKFMKWIMFAPYKHDRSIAGFGNSSDEVKGFNRKENFEYAPNLQKYLDTQGESLGNMPAFGDLQSQVNRLNAGDNIFDNMYDRARESEQERLLGMQGHNMFNRGLGQSTVFGNALGRLSRSNAEKMYADQARAIGDEQGFNARAQGAMFGGLDRLYSYAQGMRGNAPALRDRMMGMAPSVANAVQNTGLARGNQAGQTAGFLGSLLSNAGGALTGGALAGGGGGIGGMLGGLGERLRGVGNNTRIDPMGGFGGGFPAGPPVPKMGVSQNVGAKLPKFSNLSRLKLF